MATRRSVIPEEMRTVLEGAGASLADVVERNSLAVGLNEHIGSPTERNER